MYAQTAGSPTNSPTAEDKHFRLSNAINNLSLVSLALNELLRRICGPTPTEVSNKTDNAEPSLESVLNGGADRIYKRQEELLMQISSIEKTLFG